MKYMYSFLVLFSLLFNCSNQGPTQFSNEALNETFINTQGEELLFKDILKQYPNQDIVIDIWASWCKDCVEGLPKVKELQKQFPNAAYVFLSLDKQQSTWQKGIEKYKIKGNHYFAPSGWKGPFVDYIKLDWIPRYMVADADGNIKLYKAIVADDKEIAKSLTE